MSVYDKRMKFGAHDDSKYIVHFFGERHSVCHAVQKNKGINEGTEQSPRSRDHLGTWSIVLPRTPYIVRKTFVLVTL